MKKLVIVESPSKSKTIEKYLGSDFQVVSSKGHIRDLATSGKGGLGIDVDNNFEPTYKISKEKKATVKELKALAKKSDEVYLASDPDREGEAIAWHLADELGLDQDKQNRIIFHEITKPAVIEAFENPRKIDQDLVKSQETRRILDRIIGFRLSTLLRSKIKSKSAGRVQSVALHLIIERENEIRAFKQEEYWTIDALVNKKNDSFVAELKKYKGKTAKIANQEQSDAIIASCTGDYVVQSIDKKVKKKASKLPFTTSSLQQEASTKLNFSAKKTMSTAQKLYEGIEIGTGVEGLISYMRTDSTRLSEVFTSSALAYIESTYGKEYVGSVRQKKDANSQDAHEACRVTDVNRTPESIKSYLTADQYKLYKLIYARTLASLMAPAKSDSMVVQIVNNDAQFNATGSVLTFDGYLKIYKDYESSKDEVLPVLEEGEILSDVKLEGKQHFTEPPKRYSEARLIKELEEQGIGRPSTYAMIIDTLQARGYADLRKPTETTKTKVFFPTEQGELTDKKLQEFFSDIINVKYTAAMENELDEIAEGQKDYVKELRKFYDRFEPLLQEAYDKMEKIEAEKTGEMCPECGHELVIRKGRYGDFVACSNYPECKYVKQDEEDKIDETCPKCGGPLVKKRGRFGEFYACANYPECKYIKSDRQPPKETGEMCPECGKPLVERKSRYGKMFVGCSGYPKCRYIKKEEKPKDEEVDATAKSEAEKVVETKTKKKTTKKATTKKATKAKEDSRTESEE
ncbi:MULTISPECIES: type I DNA topoisomerase [unclassified Breznakia]|uniref:type I DNA topoisomerase n=1 Tax=unclassified Breznakia TaxID=2623764 RepID=UPI002476FCBA|nr:MULTISPECIES: type I DNA topoisomerase [unclassified Breznakia]MDH6366727.1 DNA topoisomerase-1 [Breznakia sp. PH1-1]MDH6403886.1 DNA topoisomerase-1 [Breznakia sp. PF1-11]MDH6411595.1 DNA topoisomerase-1 [Breznakia sp. PFB1-11]MDH6413959.1 DNA topoisomerase-1 [Breznakia sp. PFB1-14]MDH6416388.1 DNA topoisomerase-1 [Breznakia sp. PFB1-4]